MEPKVITDALDHVRTELLRGRSLDEVAVWPPHVPLSEQGRFAAVVVAVRDALGVFPVEDEDSEQDGSQARETLRVTRLRRALEIGGLSPAQKRLLRYAAEEPEARLDEVTLEGWDEANRPVLTKRNRHGGQRDRWAVRRNGDPDDPRGSVTRP